MVNIHRHTSVQYDGGDITRTTHYVGSYETSGSNFERAQVPGGFVTMSDSVFHWYLIDYQGNICGVVNSRSVELEQWQEFYPYGKPQTLLPAYSVRDGDVNDRKFGGKELITAKGFDAYDFEARRLTVSIPRFTQPDPMAEKYYPISLYAYCGGDPVNRVDKNGKDAEIIIDGTNITIKVNVILTGPLANEELAEIYKDNIDQTWGQITSYEFLGTEYSITWDVNVRLMGEGETPEFNGVNNYMEVVGEPELSQVENTHTGLLRNYGREGLPLEKDCPMAHEFGHLIGLNDKYVTDQASEFYGRPISKEWAGNIMAAPTNVGAPPSKRNMDTLLFSRLLFHSYQPFHTNRIRSFWGKKYTHRSVFRINQHNAEPYVQ